MGGVFYERVILSRTCSIPSLETRPSPSSTHVSYNYAWEYFRREKAWYILSRDACRDLRRMTFTLGGSPFI